MNMRIKSLLRAKGRGVSLALCMVAVLAASGCATGRVRDFPAIFGMVETADEALNAFQPPQVVRLQDDMVVYVWEGRKEIVIPAHHEWVRRRWISRDGWYDYDMVWFPETTHIAECLARIIASPSGAIVYRGWRGNACESFVREHPAWYDRNTPGVRKPVPGRAAKSVGQGG